MKVRFCENLNWSLRLPVLHQDNEVERCLSRRSTTVDGPETRIFTTAEGGEYLQSSKLWLGH